MAFLTAKLELDYDFLKVARDAIKLSILVQEATARGLAIVREPTDEGYRLTIRGGPTEVDALLKAVTRLGIRKLVIFTEDFDEEAALAAWKEAHSLYVATKRIWDQLARQFPPVPREK